MNIVGTNTIHLCGSCNAVNLKSSGTGTINAKELQSLTYDMNASGVMTAEVWVRDELNITAAGVVTVKYWGNPHITQHGGMLTLKHEG